MNTAIWVLQGVLALMFLISGFMKICKSKDEIKSQGGGRMDWVEDLSIGNIKLIGVLEVLAAIGLILPQLAGILTWLSPMAAAGLVLTMMVAIVFHLRRGDGVKTISINIILLLIAAFVAYGRFALVAA